MRSTIQSVGVLASVTSTGAQTLTTLGQPFMLANTGAGTMYINPATTATSANGFPVLAGTVVPLKLHVKGDLSVIGTTTATSAAVMYFDV